MGHMASLFSVGTTTVDVRSQRLGIRKFKRRSSQLQAGGVIGDDCSAADATGSFRLLPWDGWYPDLLLLAAGWHAGLRHLQTMPKLIRLCKDN